MVKNDVESGDFGHVYRIFDDLRTQKMEIAGEIGKNGKKMISPMISPMILPMISP